MVVFPLDEGPEMPTIRAFGPSIVDSAIVLVL